MVNSTPKKSGRPQAVHKTASGEQIVGLMRLADGRWRASGPEKFTFSERDEQLAVARFRQWQGKRQKATLRIPQATARLKDVESIRQAVESFPKPQPDPRRLRGTFLPPELLEQEPVVTDPGTPIRVELEGDHLLFFRNPTNADAFWPWLRRLILTNPQQVAQNTGIEQIGYLADLPKPTPSPTLDEVGKLYFTHAKISENWKAKSVLFWREFVEAVEVAKLRDLTQEQVVEYADSVHEAAQTPTYARQRFGAIKAIINYPTKRGKWAEDAKRALALCSVLVPPQKSSTDPDPISPEAFRALYAASDQQVKTMLLLALNCCMYGGEVAALDWSDLDLDKGTLVTARNKTKVVRVATLWPETVAALRELPRKAEALFLTEAGTQADYLSVYRLFKRVRKLAQQEGVQFSQIRDGAYTSAVEGGVDLNTCRLLAGHATGISDHYVKRRPQMTSAACEAIHRAYGPFKVERKQTAATAAASGSKAA